MTLPTIEQAPRPGITPSVLAAVKRLSPALWHCPYVLGRGPLHWATGLATTEELHRMATKWQLLAFDAELVAGWMEFCDVSPEQARMFPIAREAS